MELFIESYILDTKSINRYLVSINEIKVKTQYINYSKNNSYPNKFVHSISFDKDLKFSEIMDIKSILYSCDEILSAWIENGSYQELILFNKDFE